MIAKHEATPKFDPRTDAALNGGEEARRLVEELLDGIPDPTGERQQKAAKIIDAIGNLSLECARNARLEVRSRRLLQDAMGIDPRKKERGVHPMDEKRADEEYVRSLDGDWPKVVEAIHGEAGVRLWGPAIAAAERNGCGAAYVLKLFEVWKANKHRFDRPAGELHDRVRSAHPKTDVYTAWSVGDLPRPKPPSFDELLQRELGDEVRRLRESGEPLPDDLLKRWIDFHRRHGTAAEASVYFRVQDYMRDVDAHGHKGRERTYRLDTFYKSCGLIQLDPSRLLDEVIGAKTKTRA